MSDASPSPDPASSDPVEQRLAAMEKRLQSLEAELAEARADARQVLPHHEEPTFAETGTVGRDQVDDAIVPPG